MNKLTELINEDITSVYKKIDLNNFLGKTILITGASGLLGTYFLALLRKLAEDNLGKIRAIAVFQGDLLPYQKYFLDYPGAEQKIGDLADYAFCQSLPEADFIIHAAGYAQPGLFMKDQVKTLKVNTLSTFALLEKLKPGGKFLFLSSSEVYSGSPNVPYKETDIGIANTDHPRACYIEGKRGGEAICHAWRSQGVDAKAARLSLAYGPGTKPGDQRVLNSFIQRAMEGKIDLMDQGRAKRTYIYVTDAVEVLCRILLTGQGVIYNVGGKSKITIRELAQKIGQIISVPVSFPADESGGQKGAPDDVWLDTTKVEAEFGKMDYVSLDEGLGRTINWQEELYKTRQN